MWPLFSDLFNFKDFDDFSGKLYAFVSTAFEEAANAKYLYTLVLILALLGTLGILIYNAFFRERHTILIPRWMMHAVPGLLFAIFATFGLTGCFDLLLPNATIDGIFYFTPNHIGSISLVTDQYGGVVKRYKYKPYGEKLEDKGYTAPGYEDFSVKYTFTAQEDDDTTGLYYYNARFYDPEIGRFITPDSMVPNPRNTQHFNRYMYCSGNPVNYNDPSGHEESDGDGASNDSSSESDNTGGDICGIAAALEAAFDAIAGAFEGIASAIEGAITGAIEGISNAITNALGEIENAISGIFSGWDKGNLAIANEFSIPYKAGHYVSPPIEQPDPLIEHISNFFTAIVGWLNEQANTNSNNLRNSTFGSLPNDSGSIGNNTSPHYEYSQTFGTLTQVDDQGNRTYVGTGYAGFGPGVNNPAMARVENIGPLPVGTYTIGPQHNHITSKNIVLKGALELTPTSMNYMFGRSGFFIQGDNSSRNHTASAGCPVFDDPIRNAIGRSRITTFEVVE
jgi:RHS repeat-associated protein